MDMRGVGQEKKAHKDFVKPKSYVVIYELHQ